MVKFCTINRILIVSRGVKTPLTKMGIKLKRPPTKFADLMHFTNKLNSYCCFKNTSFEYMISDIFRFNSSAAGKNFTNLQRKNGKMALQVKILQYALLNGCPALAIHIFCLGIFFCIGKRLNLLFALAE